MAQRPGFDMNKLSMGSKGLLGTGILLLVALFLPWQSVDVGFGIGDVSRNGFNGLGVIIGILLIGLIVWEGLLAAGVSISTGSTSPAMISVYDGAAASLLTVIHFLLRLDFVSFGAFLGLIAALAMAYATWVRYHEARMGGPAAPPPAPPMPPPPPPA